MNRQKKKKTGKKLALSIGISLSVLLVVFFIFFIVSNPLQAQLIKKSMKNCFQEKNCIERIMLKPFDYPSIKMHARDCDSRTNPLFRDACIFGMRYREYEHHVNPLIDHAHCYVIEDPYLSKMCLRTLFRIHMNQFMLHPRLNVTSLNIAQKGIVPSACIAPSPFESIQCAYATAAHEAKKNISRAKGICYNLNNTRLEGECLFHAALGMSFDIKEDPSFGRNISFFCDTIENRFWRMECHYLVADEVSQLPQQQISIESVAKSCHESKSLSSFQCFDHVTYYLPRGSLLDFCNVPMEEHERSECFGGYGGQLYFSNDLNIEKAKEECSQVPSAYVHACRMGVITNFAQRSPEEMSAIVTQCANEDTSLSKLCMMQFVSRTTRQCGGNAQECLSMCTHNFPEEWKTLCVQGIGYNSALFSGYDLQTPLKKCLTLPTEWQEGCIIGIGKAFGGFVAENESFARNACLSYPPKESSYCVQGLGYGMMKKNEPRIADTLSSCTLLPSELQTRCLQGISNRFYLIDDRDSCLQLPSELQDLCNGES